MNFIILFAFIFIEVITLAVTPSEASPVFGCFKKPCRSEPNAVTPSKQSTTKLSSSGSSELKAQGSWRNSDGLLVDDPGLKPGVKVTVQGVTYTIKEEKGRGVQAIAYLAYDAKNKPVIIKRARGPPARSIESIKDEEAMLKKAGMLIGTSSEKAKQGTVYYAVMEYVEGDTVKKVLAGLKNPADIAALRKKFEEGLKKLHEQGITHNDGFPVNAILKKTGSVKFVDMGKAKPLDGLEKKKADEWKDSDLWYAGHRFDQQVTAQQVNAQQPAQSVSKS